MNKFSKDSLDKITALKGARMDGSIQNTTMRSDILDMDAEQVYLDIIQALLVDKANLNRENQWLGNILKKNGLYTSENLFG